jgi:hypothetical protein
VDAPDTAEAGASGALARRLDLALLAAALVVALTAGLLDVGAPWEDGFKGTNGGAYTYRFLQSHLQLGLGVTRGACVKGVDPLTHELILSLNHPATYVLLHLPAAWLFGLSEATVRVVALLLYLPAVPILWWLARRLLGAPAAGACALLFASAPMVAYYGPMAVHDGPLLALFPLVAGAFLVHVAAPTRATRCLLAGAVLATCLLDWSGAFLLPLLLLLVPATADRRRAWRVLLGLAPLATLALALLFAHTAFVLGGVRAAGEQWVALFLFSQAPHAGWPAVVGGEAGDAVTLLGPVRLALAAAGLLLALWLRGEGGWLRRAALVGVALLLPGLLNIALFPAHAQVHDFWSMMGVPGLALLAALPVAAAWRAKGAAARAAEVLLLALAAYVAVTGTLQARALVRSQATTLHRDVGVLLDRWFGPGDVVASSVNITLTDVYTQALIVGPITTPEQARRLAEEYAPPAFTGKLGFLLPRRERDTPLGKALGEMAAPEEVPDALLFRLRP